MSGPGPNIPWLTDVLSKTGNYVQPQQVAPVIEMTAAAEAGDMVAVTVNIEPLNGVTLTNILCLAWVALTLGDTPVTLSAFTLTDGVELAQVGEAYLVLLADGEVIELTTAAAVDGSFYLAPLSSGHIYAVDVLFAGP